MAVRAAAMGGCRARRPRRPIPVRVTNKKTKRTLSLLFLTENLQAEFSAENLFSLPICVIMGWVMQMDKEKELPKRKDLRLKQYDYSSAGACFITICTQNRRCVLSRIVGRGLAPAETTARIYLPRRDCGETTISSCRSLSVPYD